VVTAEVGVLVWVLVVVDVVVGCCVFVQPTFAFRQHHSRWASDHDANSIVVALAKATSNSTRLRRPSPSMSSTDEVPPWITQRYGSKEVVPFCTIAPRGDETGAESAGGAAATDVGGGVGDGEVWIPWSRSRKYA